MTRLVRDLVFSEMQALRPGLTPTLHTTKWPQTLEDVRALHLTHDLGLDSLELMSVSAALCDALGSTQLNQVDALFQSLTMGHWADVLTGAWRDGPPQRRFRTSGSTGAPRSVTHPLPWLHEEVCHWASLLNMPQRVRRVVAAVRAHHIYGHLFTVMLPSHLSCPVLDAAWAPPPLVLPRLQAGDLVVAHPDWWRAVARCGHPLPAGLLGLTATAPCPPELDADLHRLGLDTLVHIYGSTETAGVGWRLDAHQAYTLLPWWQVAPPQQLSRCGPDGTPHTIALPDVVTWLDDRHLLPSGRLDQAVQVGGVNVQPEAVRQHYLQHPAVRDAAVRLHPFAGVPRLKAFIVPHDMAGVSALTTELQAHGLRLPPAARPAHLTLGAQLPTNEAGKACDWPVTAAPGHLVA